MTRAFKLLARIEPESNLHHCGFHVLPDALAGFRPGQKLMISAYANPDPMREMRHGELTVLSVDREKNFVETHEPGVLSAVPTALPLDYVFEVTQVPCTECGGSENPAAWGHKDTCSFWDGVRPPKVSGMKFDQGKARYDLLPFKALEEVVLVLTFGANKYEPDGWRKVPGWRWRYFGAACRHLVAWFAKGEQRDPESGLHHLAHAACCVLFMLELDIDAAQK